MSLQSRFIRGMVSGGGAYAIKAVCNIFLIPLLIRFLGTECYGLYVFLIGLAEMLLMMDAGITTGLIQRLSYYRSRNDTSRIPAQMGTAKLLYIVFSCGLLGSGLLLYTQVPVWFHWPSKLFLPGSIATLLIFVEASLNLNNNYYQALLKSCFLYEKTNLIEVFQAFANTASAVCILWLGLDFVYIFLFRILVSCVATIYLRTISLRVDEFARNAKLRFCLDDLKDLFSISFFAMVQRVSIFIAHRIDDFVIALFLNLVSVGLYAMVLKVFGQISGFCIKILEGVLPVFTHTSGSDKTEKSRFLFLRSSALMSILSGGLILLALFNYPEIIQFLSNGKINFSNTLSIAIMVSIISWSGAIQIPASNYLFSSGLHRFQTYSSLITALINLGLSIILVQKSGMIGVALGTLIPHFIQHNFVTVLFACKRLSISMVECLTTIYIKPALCIGLGILPLAVYRYLIGWQTFNLFFMGFISVIAASCITACWFMFSASLLEKKLIKDQVITIFGLRKCHSPSSVPRQSETLNSARPNEVNV